MTGVTAGDRLRSGKAAWRRLTPLQRMQASVGVLAAAAIALGFVDTSLGIGIAAAAALYGLSKLPPRPRLVGQVALVAAFAYPEPSFAELSRVRVLHVFRDRGGEEVEVEPPYDFSWTPAPLSLMD